MVYEAYSTTEMTPTSITRRPVRPADGNFLLDLFASTRNPGLRIVPGTPDEKRHDLEMQFHAQTAGYAKDHPRAAHEIILASGREAGRIYWDIEPERLYILDITVAPGSRNAGIGSAVLREVIAVADREGKPVAIHVEPHNPSRRLFERLGFGVAVNSDDRMLLERPAAPREV